MMKSVPWVDVFSSACVDSMRVHHLVVFLVRGAPQQATVISSPQAAVGMFACRIWTHYIVVQQVGPLQADGSGKMLVRRCPMIDTIACGGFR